MVEDEGEEEQLADLDYLGVGKHLRAESCIKLDAVLDRLTISYNDTENQLLLRYNNDLQHETCWRCTVPEIRTIPNRSF